MTYYAVRQAAFWQAAASTLGACANQSKEDVTNGDYQHKTEDEFTSSLSYNDFGFG